MPPPPLPLGNTLYHQYLRGEPATPSTASIPSPCFATLPSPPPLPSYHWDLLTPSPYLIETYSYISRKLSAQNLSLTLIISDRSPFLIPLGPLPRQTLQILRRIIRKALTKYPLPEDETRRGSEWMTYLTSLPISPLAAALREYSPESYLVHRSLLQDQRIHTSEGLNLLSIDYIHTFKTLICTLAKPKWVSEPARVTCLASCVRLYHRIKCIYTGKPVNPGYVERVYPEIPFHVDTLDEVACAYNTKYCTATINEVQFEPDWCAAAAAAEDDDEEEELNCAELPERQESTSFLVSPVAKSRRAPSPNFSFEDTVEAQNANPLGISYPRVQAPSSSASTPPPALSHTSSSDYSSEDDDEDNDDHDNGPNMTDMESIHSPSTIAPSARWPAPLRVSKLHLPSAPISPLSSTYSFNRTLSLHHRRQPIRCLRLHEHRWYRQGRD